MQLNELIQYLDVLLEPERFRDYAPNGLQVEGRPEVLRLVCGVSASQDLIDTALAHQADAILVHHGYFWKNEDRRILGIKRKRLKSLLQNDISLLAYHLPLDAHSELGNNAQLALRLSLLPQGQTGEQNLLWYGQLAQPCRADTWVDGVSLSLQRRATLLGRPDKLISRVAWCTGAAQGMFADAIALGVDAFITGEVSEQNQHMAKESDCVFVAAGHHATERYGIQALVRQIHHDLGMDVEFIDVDNPI
jgi:dinuclear metal center YbgI/SA1388 family protein